MSNNRPHANQTAAAYPYAFTYDRPAPYESPISDHGVTIHNCGSRNMAVIADRHAVLKQRTAVDDAIDADLSASTYDGAMHDNRSLVYICMTRQVRYRRNNHRKFIVECLESLKEIDPEIWRTDLSNSNQGITCRSTQLRKCCIDAQNRIAANRRPNFFLPPNKSNYFHTTCLFKKINTRNCVPPCANYNQRSNRVKIHSYWPWKQSCGLITWGEATAHSKEGS